LRYGEEIGQNVISITYQATMNSVDVNSIFAANLHENTFHSIPYIASYHVKSTRYDAHKLQMDVLEIRESTTRHPHSHVSHRLIHILCQQDCRHENHCRHHCSLCLDRIELYR